MKEKKKRGIRKPAGYTPGNPNTNLYVSTYDYAKGGNAIVCGEAVRFFFDCKTFSNLMMLELAKNGELFANKSGVKTDTVRSNGYNVPAMKFYGMKRKHVDGISKALAFEMCEHIIRAIETQDDYFFRDLARLCKYEKSRPVITLENWLVHIHWDILKGLGPNSKQTRYFTAPDLCKLAKLRGNWDVDARRMHEICGKLGIELLKGRSKNGGTDLQYLLKKLKESNRRITN